MALYLLCSKLTELNYKEAALYISSVLHENIGSIINVSSLFIDSLRKSWESHSWMYKANFAGEPIWIEICCCIIVCKFVTNIFARVIIFSHNQCFFIGHSFSLKRMTVLRDHRDLYISPNKWLPADLDSSTSRCHNELFIMQEIRSELLLISI